LTIIENARKQVFIEVDPKRLKRYHPRRRVTSRKIYAEIGDFFISEGWEVWRRKALSARSKVALDEEDIKALVMRLVMQLPWFNDCVTVFDMCNIKNVQQFDFKTMSFMSEEEEV